MSKLKFVKVAATVGGACVVASQLLNIVCKISNISDHSEIDNSSSYNEAFGTLSFGLLTIGSAIAASGLVTALYSAGSGLYDFPEGQAEALEMMGLVPIEDTYVGAA